MRKYSTNSHCPACGSVVVIIHDKDPKGKTWYRAVCKDTACEINRTSAAATTVKETKKFWQEICKTYIKERERKNDNE